ncbi:phospholipid/cholesterol/gamma-HCH transport system substrate-binding protein [Nocardioides sp. SLBN-35]|nr:phospholipid/cholesterol/gamma-HCH transport system substrate-binding protein [Nocardioides sp. SLBN-35]
MPMKPVRDRNPTVVGVVGVAILALGLALALSAKHLPVIGDGATYRAQFTEVGGLKKGDDVRMAGVRVGKVTALDLDGATVTVSFTVSDHADQLRADTEASIRIKTLLGTMYVALEPKGAGRLDAGDTIPTSRTTPPYDVVAAFSDLTTTTQQIDTDQLAHAMDVLADASEHTPDGFRGTVDGITRLSQNLVKRDEQIDALLKNLSGVADTLDARKGELARLFRDGGTLFAALTARRQAVHDLLVAVRDLSSQLRGLVRDTNATLKPTLVHLDSVLDVLEANEKSIDTALETLPTFYDGVNSATGNGPWIDGFIYNLMSMLGVPGL